MADKASLDTLPVEIFESIAEDLGKADLKSLRLVNRESAAKALRVYSTYLFEDLAFFVNNEESLRLAITIADHPVFAKSVRKITFIVDEIDTSWPMDGSWAKGEYENWIDFSMAQNYLHNNGASTRLLTELFNRFAALKHLDRISIGDLSSSGPKPTCCAEFQKHKTLVTPRRSDYRPFGLIVEAYQRSSLEVPSFAIIPGRWCLWTWNLGRCRQNKLLTDAEELDLCMWADDRSDLNRGVWENFNPSIRRLRLQTRGDLPLNDRRVDRSLVFQELMKQTFPALEVLTLVGHEVNLQSFKEFAQRHKCLKRIDLKDILIEDYEDFIEEDESIKNCVRRVLGVPGTYTGLDIITFGVLAA